MADPTLYAYVGAIVATVLATLIPYWNATRSRPGTAFDWWYAVSAVFTALAALPGSTAIWAMVLAFVEPYPALVPYLDNLWFALALGLAVGAFLNRWVNENIIDKARKAGLLPKLPERGPHV